MQKYIGMIRGCNIYMEGGNEFHIKEGIDYFIRQIGIDVEYQKLKNKWWNKLYFKINKLK